MAGRVLQGCECGGELVVGCLLNARVGGERYRNTRWTGWRMVQTGKEVAGGLVGGNSEGAKRRLESDAGVRFGLVGR